MKKIQNIMKHASQRLPILIVGTVILTVSLMQLFGVSSSIAARFVKEEVSVTEAPKGSEGLVPTRIVIDKADIDLPVVPVKMENGTWKVNNGVANYAVETSKISTKEGNVGLYAHDLPNGFSRIKNLTAGDLIEITATDNVAMYKVMSKHVTNPSDVDAFYPTNTPTLTLVTCDGAFSAQRLIVKAELISIKKGNEYESVK